MKKCFTPKDKLWKVMKICSLQAMIAITLCSLAFAHDNFGQVLDKKITLSLKEVSIEEALEAIEKLTNVKFFYSVDQLDIKDRISFEAVDLALRDLLDEMLGPYNINYNVHERKATITLKRENRKVESRRRGGRDSEQVAVAGPYVVATITGRVTDAATEQPMAGVNIIVKGTTEGTTTDSEGNYSIWAEDKDVLVFSFIGFQSVETPVNGRTRIDILMEEDVTGLQVVEVNAGYWKVSERERTGNIVRISSEEIQKQPVGNPIAALQGRVAGLEIIQQTGVPGGNFTIRIRGQNSIANGNDPLFIIDGVPYNSSTMAFNEGSSEIYGNALAIGGSSPLNAINPADIESIEILKDADATAIYGSRGANGVILITTKRGKAGETKIDFNFYRAAGRVASKMDLLDGPQYIAMRKEALKNSNIERDRFNAPDLTVWDTTRFTDWQKKLIGGTAQTTDAQVSISGGDKSTQFSIGAGYRKEGTVFPGDYSGRRVSTHISLSNSSLNQKLHTLISLKHAINNSDLLKRDLTSLALTLPPVTPTLYEHNGDLNWSDEWGTNAWTDDFPHPLRYLKTSYEATTQNLLISATTRYEILSNLEIKLNMGYSDVGMNAITLTPKSSFAPSVAIERQNQSVFSTSNFKNWTLEPQINWRPVIGNSRLNILIGSTFLEQVRDGLAQYAYGFADEALMKNIGASSTRTLATNYYSQYRYNSAFARVNYILNEKYIFNTTGRRDGSSRFGPGNQFANFGAIGAAWLFSEEAFVKEAIPFLSFGKIRGSYGITGNDQLGDYQYLDTYTSSGLYQGKIGLTPVRLANSEFAWETNVKAEGGLEIGFLEDRISGSISYYNNISSNQLIGFSLPPTTGFTTIQGNLPAVVQNRGIEIVFFTRNIEKQDFRWSSSFNITVPRNELVEFPNLEASPVYANTLVEGEPLNILKRYNYLAVDTRTGLYTFEDVDGNGSINSLDRQEARFVGQDFYGGFQNTFHLKGFELDVWFQFVKQSKLNYLSVFVANPGEGLSNQPVWVLNRWQSEGDIAETQRFSVTPEGLAAYTFLTGSTRSISDASFIRLKNVAVSYALPKNLSRKLKLEHWRIFIQGQNLLTFTNYKGLDPEPSSTYSLPPLKVVSAGISISL